MLLETIDDASLGEASIRAIAAGDAKLRALAERDAKGQAKAIRRRRAQEEQALKIAGYIASTPSRHPSPLPPTGSGQSPT